MGSLVMGMGLALRNQDKALVNQAIIEEILEDEEWSVFLVPRATSSSRLFQTTKTQCLRRELGTMNYSDGASNLSEPVDTEEDGDVLRAFTHYCNTVNPDPMSVYKGKSPMMDHSVPATKSTPSIAKLTTESRNGKGLMYMYIKLKGKFIRAMIDTRVTHNYLAKTKVQGLGLVLEKGAGRVKAINSPGQPIVGITRGVQIKAGPYEGKSNFSIIQMDDFKVTLGLQFLGEAKASVMPL